ncbi:MAG: Ig-like domain-containing protein [Saprospiraceae bacterium]|nr:Ig-like domain-containing protein [Saprospiraceae bacterium]
MFREYSQCNSSTNGSWTSRNNSVATITNAGLVSSVSAGKLLLLIQEAATDVVHLILLPYFPILQHLLLEHNTTHMFHANRICDSFRIAGNR